MIHLDIQNQKTSFSPGETIAAKITWQLEKSVNAIELRLFWHTNGKGTQDINIVNTLRFTQPPQRDTRPFQFQLPSSPYSFSGKLISLIWAIEAVTDPLDEAGRQEFILSPTGREILLCDTFPANPVNG
ncbi:MAG: hypothetical protein PHV34_24930 [Verrucomicrobiae bacterium]|nr:hypothetical protein [Verrucomicrobiae bacterium]